MKSTLIITFSAYTIIHFINLAINNAQLLDFNGEVIKVSYMFSIYSPDFANPVLDFFYSIIPYDYWYFFLSIPIIIIYLMIWYLPGIIKAKRKKHSKNVKIKNNGHIARDFRMVCPLFYLFPTECKSITLSFDKRWEAFRFFS